MIHTSNIETRCREKNRQDIITTHLVHALQNTESLLDRCSKNVLLQEISSQRILCKTHTLSHKHTQVRAHAHAHTHIHTHTHTHTHTHF